MWVFFQKVRFLMSDLHEETLTMLKHLKSGKTDDSTKIPLISTPEDETVNEESHLTWLEKIWKIVSLLLWLITFYIAVISSQVSGLKGNIFGLISARCLVMFALISPIVLLKRCPLTIQKKHIYIIVAAGLTDMISITCVFSVATYMAVGNLDAIFVSFYCIISVLVDFVRRIVTWRPMICAAIASIGVLMISQPWRMQEKEGTLAGPPCNYLDDIIDLTGNISNISMKRTNEHQSLHHDSMTIGYVLLVIAAAALVTSGNFVKKVTVNYPLPTVMFWQSLFEGFACFSIGMVWTRSMNESYLIYPGGTYCLLFTLLFIICSGFAQLTSFLAYKYFAISTMALSCISVSLFLYVSQRTFLKAFHPGHANVLEFFGIAVTIFATAILPAIFVCFEQNQQHK